MPHTEEVAYSIKECGTCNPTFSFLDTSDTNEGARIGQEHTSAVSDTTLILTDIMCVPVNLNNNTSTPTKAALGLHTFHPAKEEVALVAAPPKDNPVSPPGKTRDTNEAKSNTSAALAVHDDTRSSPLTSPDSQAATTDGPVGPVTNPSSSSSIPWSDIKTTTAEMDNPVQDTQDKIPLHSPLQSSLLPEGTGTSPPTPEHGPLKATLVHIDTTPTDSPPETPEKTAETVSTEAEEPSTSLIDPDQIDPSDPADEMAAAGSPSQDRRLSTNSGNAQDGCRVGDEDDDGFLGDEDADKNSEGELESDEEELLRVMARCNPIFITFRK